MIKSNENAEKTLAALSRLMPNIRGPRDSKRAMFCGVVQSIALYVPQVWIPAMKMEKYRRILFPLQRRGALKVI